MAQLLVSKNSLSELLNELYKSKIINLTNAL